ncbi:DUF4129 domain-containing protein [Cellulomonas fimi]|uniref:DUF4129 domain-containing protein n=1 Tax=Cellulomonas fimi TaxID=1708 RepID=A0A7Y0LZ16_CELFI|nr:DUF4129 domain-containing protein [Cellulomonas fimi]NMR20798.1 DUF4129 domain-containing protein [Cellulomonas fimi]
MTPTSLARAGVPVVPDAPTARRWAEQELADPVYHRGPSLLDRFLEWVGSLFQDASVPSLGMPPGLFAAVVVGVVLVVAAVAFWVAGPVRLARRASGSAVVLGADLRSAADLRAAADASAARGDWSAAVLDRFRALVRGLEERAVLDERPGRTAHEAAEATAARFAAHAHDVRRGGRLFDDVCYGHAGADADDDAWLRRLDSTLAADRPDPVPGRSPAVSTT